ncbi:MAG: hypothetical protein NZ957_04415 [Thaumarchaeota archaeon]|nr:hypothetical protein [Candidatus Calditenuaceae archaeon]MDW8041465.1 hypothetical protein [Nitrososphaerota archaeon]
MEALFTTSIDLFPHTVHVRVFWDRIEIKAPLFRMEIPFSDVEGINSVERIPWYVGRGIEPYLHNRTLYIIDRRKNCVEIRKSTGFWRRLVLSVKQPDLLIEAVKRHSGRGWIL